MVSHRRKLRGSEERPAPGDLWGYADRAAAQELVGSPQFMRLWVGQSCTMPAHEKFVSPASSRLASANASLSDYDVLWSAE